MPLVLSRDTHGTQHCGTPLVPRLFHARKFFDVALREACRKPATGDWSLRPRHGRLGVARQYIVAGLCRMAPCAGASDPCAGLRRDHHRNSVCPATREIGYGIFKPNWTQRRGVPLTAQTLVFFGRNLQIESTAPTRDLLFFSRFLARISTLGAIRAFPLPLFHPPLRHATH